MYQYVLLIQSNRNYFHIYWPRQRLKAGERTSPSSTPITLFSIFSTHQTLWIFFAGLHLETSQPRSSPPRALGSLGSGVTLNITSPCQVCYQEIYVVLYSLPMTFLVTQHYIQYILLILTLYASGELKSTFSSTYKCCFYHIDFMCFMHCIYHVMSSFCT